MKKLIVCLAILVVAGYAQAAQNVLIGSWESSTNEGWYDFPTAASHSYSPEPDAWVDNAVQQGNPLTAAGLYGYAFDDSWYTEGYQSLKIQMQGATGDNSWGNKLAVSVKNDWLDNSQLSFDMYSTGGWAQIVSINMNAQSTGGSYGTLAMFGGDWANFPWQSGAPQHVVLDTTPFRGDGWANATDGWMNIIFQVQGSADAYMYIDNVRLDVPEPATMGLLGLGGLALLRRKK